MNSERGLLKKYIRYVGLSIMGMAGLSLYILADTFFVAAGLGAEGLAALNLALPVYGFLNGMGILLGVGGATRYTILKNRGDSKAESVFGHTLILGIVISVIFIMLGVFASSPISYVLGADELTYPPTFMYLRVTLCFAPAYIFNNIFLAFLRNDGSPKLAMAAMLISSSLNAVMDYIFMFQFKWGMFGAAFSTGLGTVMGVIAMLLHFRSRHNSLKLTKSLPKVRDIGRIAMPGMSGFVAEISTGIVLIVFNLVILRLEGNLGVAAYAIVTNLAFVAAAIFTGLAQGVQPLISEAFGQGHTKSSRRLLEYGLITALIIATLIYLTISLFSGGIVWVYNSSRDATLAAIAAKGLKMYFVGYFVAGANYVIAAYLSASGRGARGFAVSLIRGLAAIVPLVILMSFWWGITGVWMSFVCAEALTLGIAVVLLRSSPSITNKTLAKTDNYGIY